MDIWVVALLPPKTQVVSSVVQFPLLEGLMQEAVRREDPGRREHNPGWWEQGDLAVGSVSQALSDEREPRGQPGGHQRIQGR